MGWLFAILTEGDKTISHRVQMLFRFDKEVNLDTVIQSILLNWFWKGLSLRDLHWCLFECFIVLHDRCKKWIFFRALTLSVAGKIFTKLSRDHCYSFHRNFLLSNSLKSFLEDTQRLLIAELYLAALVKIRFCFHSCINSKKNILSKNEWLCHKVTCHIKPPTRY